MFEFSVQAIEPWKLIIETRSKLMWTQYSQGEYLEDSKASLRYVYFENVIVYVCVKINLINTLGTCYGDV